MRASVRLGLVPIVVSSIVGPFGCGSPQPRSRVEDQSRRVAPLSACVLHLPARGPGSAGTTRSLREEQIVKLMFPTFDEATRTLPQNAQSCTGANVFEDPMFRDARLVRGEGWPFVEQEGDVLYGSGGDRLKIVWLRTHTMPDGSSSGPLAVIRSGEHFAELFAIGAYRSQPERTRLATVRMGGDFLLTAENDGCSARKQGTSCQTMLTVFLPRKGRLHPIVDVPVERIAFSGRAERGAIGALEYHLTSVPDFRDNGIKLVEHVRVKDDTGRVLRNAEHESLITISDEGTATATATSLWDEVTAAPKPADAKPAPRQGKH